MISHDLTRRGLNHIHSARAGRQHQSPLGKLITTGQSLNNVLYFSRPQSQGQPQQPWKTWWPGIGESVPEVYPRRLVTTLLEATLLADGPPCFALCACPALV